MNINRAIIRLAKVVVQEAAQNPEFRSRLEDAFKFLTVPSVSGLAAVIPPQNPLVNDAGKRKGGRRSPALLDPIELVAISEADLRVRLGELNLNQLHDIVAQYGMDPGKLVMKWKDQTRVIERIIEVATARATKGDSFRKE